MISNRLIKLTEKNSAIREMFEEGNRLSALYGKDNVYDFSLGNPSVETPIEVKNVIKQILDNNSSFDIHGYMPNAGYKCVRENIAYSLKSKYGINYTFSNVIMTVGAAGGLNCILQALLNPGDEVIANAPYFVEYGNYITNWGGEIVVAKTSELDFLLSKENISKVVSEKTKAIIINNPNNPTGVVYDVSNIKSVCEMLMGKEKQYKHPIYIISDEPYRDLAYDGISVPFIPNYYKNTIIVYSWSKSLSLPGERIGYIAINPNAQDSELISRAAIISNRIIGFVNAPSLFQHVINHTLSVIPKIDLYDYNRKILYENLKRIGYECVYPQGAFYLWMKTPCDENRFIEEAKKFRLLLVPGSSFNYPGYVRIAYCVSKNSVINSIPAFMQLWNDIKQ